MKTGLIRNLNFHYKEMKFYNDMMHITNQYR